LTNSEAFQAVLCNQAVSYFNQLDFAVSFARSLSSCHRHENPIFRSGLSANSFNQMTERVSSRPLNYLDLGDVESLASAPTRLDGPRHTNYRTMKRRLMARSLREYGADLSLIPQLEQRIEERKRRYQAEMQNRMRGN
jgi:hypothetical protein